MDMLMLMDVLESSESEYTSSSSSDDDEDVVFVLKNSGQGPGPPIPRLQGYLENVVAKYNVETFKSHFRMYPDTLNYLLSLIGPHLMKTNSTAGRKPIDSKKQLLIAIRMMATPDSYRSVCEKFGVGRATALRSVRRVARCLHALARRIIQWPKGAKANAVMAEFEKYSGFSNIIGAIDWTHIKINRPKNDGASYINRKGTYSVQVQVLFFLLGR